MDKSYISRKELGEKIKKWASSLGFHLRFSSQERVSKKDTYKISSLECNVKSCKFYIEFRTSKNSNNYTLFQAWNFHNHSLKNRDMAVDITPEISTRISQLKGCAKNPAKLAEAINKEFKKNFDCEIMRYQLKKIKYQEFGFPSDDAYTMVKLFEQEENQSQLFFQKKLDEYKTLQNFCFMTKRMQNLYSHFNDIIVMDTTHKTNRFGMPLLDIIIINNMGQSCTVFIAFLKNQKYETFLWSPSTIQKWH